MHTFQITELIQVFESFTCFEPHVFIMRSTVCTHSFVWYIFHAFLWAV